MVPRGRYRRVVFSDPLASGFLFLFPGVVIMLTFLLPPILDKQTVAVTTDPANPNSLPITSLSTAGLFSSPFPLPFTPPGGAVQASLTALGAASGYAASALASSFDLNSTLNNGDYGAVGALDMNTVAYSETAAFPTMAGAQTRCIDSCEHASNNDCDDGGSGAEYSGCSLGTDCTDCGPRTVSSVNATTILHNASLISALPMALRLFDQACLAVASPGATLSTFASLLPYTGEAAVPLPTFYGMLIAPSALTYIFMFFGMAIVTGE